MKDWKAQPALDSKYDEKQWKFQGQGMILLLDCFYSAIYLEQGQGTAVQFCC